MQWVWVRDTYLPESLFRMLLLGSIPTAVYYVYKGERKREGRLIKAYLRATVVLACGTQPHFPLLCHVFSALRPYVEAAVCAEAHSTVWIRTPHEIDRSLLALDLVRHLIKSSKSTPVCYLDAHNRLFFAHRRTAQHTSRRNLPIPCRCNPCRLRPHKQSRAYPYE